MSLTSLDNKYTDKNTIHSYLPLYETLLQPIKESARAVLEVGVFKGGSIKLWHDYFKNASIYGCDISDKNLRESKLKFIRNLNRRRTKFIKTLRESDRIILYLNEDSYTEQYVTKFNNIKFDFMLDDGPHTLQSQKDFIKLYSHLLSDNGILIIEDVQDIKWIDELKNITPENLKQYIKIYDLRKNKVRYDDIVFTIDKVNS
jgi:hypothetical protein